VTAVHASLDDAAALINRAQFAQAREVLAGQLRRNVRNAQAWFLLSQCVESDEQRRQCLRRVLALDPDHSLAVALLERLNSADITADAAEPARVTASGDPLADHTSSANGEIQPPPPGSAGLASAAQAHESGRDAGETSPDEPLNSRPESAPIAVVFSAPSAHDELTEAPSFGLGAEAGAMARVYESDVMLAESAPPAHPIALESAPAMTQPVSPVHSELPSMNVPMIAQAMETGPEYSDGTIKRDLAAAYVAATSPKPTPPTETVVPAEQPAVPPFQPQAFALAAAASAAHDGAPEFVPQPFALPDQSQVQTAAGTSQPALPEWLRLPLADQGG
jgi:hypothetical protein